MWRTVKDMKLSNKQVPPRMLFINDKVTTSLRKICNYANDLYINKVNKLRDKFVENISITPIQILKFFIPRVNQELIFPPYYP